MIIPVKKKITVYLVTHDYLEWTDSEYLTQEDAQIPAKLFRSRKEAEEYAVTANQIQIDEIIDSIKSRFGPEEVKRLKEEENTDWATYNLYNIREMEIS